MEYWSSGVMGLEGDWESGHEWILPSTPVEQWSIGVLEYWGIGVLGYWEFRIWVVVTQHSITPTLQPWILNVERLGAFLISAGSAGGFYLPV
jgi:hypothetical protein